jgi:DNA polymerase III subunit beta
MKIIFDREPFWTAFQAAATVAPTRSPKPILQNVKLDVTESGGMLLATDMEVGVRLAVPGLEIEKPGSVVLPVARFGSLLRESSDDKLKLETTERGTTVKGDRSEFKLSGENPDEFPTVTSFDESKFHEVPARLLKELIRRTIFATDTDSGRYALGGVLLEFHEDRIIAVGTDGRRMAKMEGPAKSTGGHLSGDAMTIVPTRSMHLIERLLTDADAEVQIAARANDILVRTPRGTIYSRLVEGRFPRWRDVLPQRHEAAKVDFNVGPFYSALRQAAIVTSDDSRGIDFTFGEGMLEMVANTAEVGQARVELPTTFEGAKTTVILDNRFVADFCKVLDPEKTFTFEFGDGDGPVLLSTEDGYGYVVMPLARD